MINSINNNCQFYYDFLNKNLTEGASSSEKTPFEHVTIENTSSRERVENAPIHKDLRIQIGLATSVGLFLLGALVSIGLFIGGFGYPVIILAIAATAITLISSLILIKKMHDAQKVKKIISSIDFNPSRNAHNSLKKCLILSSEGGGGHKAATEAIQAHLRKKNIEIAVFYPIGERKIFGFSGEAFYNFLLTHKYIGIINFLGCFLAPLLFRCDEGKTKVTITKYLKKENPDLLISVIPYINYPASKAAEDQNIPFLLSTVDNDLSHWVDRLDKMTHPNARITIGHDRPSTRAVLENKGISADKIRAIGLPLRPSFTSSIDKQRLLDKHEVPAGRSVVLIMMGAVGTEITYQYVKELAAFPKNLHLIVCAGRNALLAERLEAIPFADGNSRKILPFTDAVHELMAICDLIITKPGSSSVTEAMARQLPILLDRTSKSLKWELANIEIVEESGIGESIYSIKDLRPKVAKLLDKDERERINERYSFIQSNRFNEEFPKIIQELFPSSSELESVNSIE